jgi:hypothetical protein
MNTVFIAYRRARVGMTDDDLYVRKVDASGLFELDRV